MLRPRGQFSASRFLTGALLMLLCFAASHARAQGGVVTGGGTTSAPEIDPSVVSGGLALLGGVVLLLRAKRT